MEITLKNEQIISAWLWSLIITIISIVVTVVSICVSIAIYNSRFDADATSSGGLTYTFSANGTSYASDSLTTSAGDLNFGYMQSTGAIGTSYEIYYKKNSSTSFIYVKEVYAMSNSTYYGEYDLTYSYSTQKYDVKIVKKSNLSTKSILYFYWGVS